MDELIKPRSIKNVWATLLSSNNQGECCEFFFIAYDHFLETHHAVPSPLPFGKGTQTTELLEAASVVLTAR